MSGSRLGAFILATGRTIDQTGLYAAVANLRRSQETLIGRPAILWV